MKLVFAILNRDDSNTVVKNLSQHGFYSTKLSTSGGFLLSSNVTLMIGVEEEKVQDVIDIVREYSHARKQIIPTGSNSLDFDVTMPVEVTVGGATIFVVDVDRFEKV